MKYTVHFRHGHVVKVSPHFSGDLYDNREIIYEADTIVSDGTPYSLTDKESIYSIAIPDFGADDNLGSGLGVTGSLDYDLRMRASKHWNDGHYDLAVACLEKATFIMQYSSVGWPKKDFYRIVNWLIDLGCLTKAREWQDWIDRNIHEERRTTEDELEKLLNSCDMFKTNLVKANNVWACCEKCAKYRNRIYRIRGMDVRFPKLPTDYHADCCLFLYPFAHSSFDSAFPGKNAILYSNRPFVDDRTEQEKEAYQKRLEAIRQQEESIIWAKPNVARTSYYLLKKYFPDDAPKSMSGFSRMRNANSKRYQALIKKAEEVGISLPETIADLYQMEERGEFL